MENRMKPGNAFSLIELLVVISVIAVLASLLLPVLNKALEKARSISCLNNEKTTGIAIMNYTLENDEWLVIGSGGYGNLNRWYLFLSGKMTNGMPHPVSSRNYGVVYTGNKVTTGTFACPSEEKPFTLYEVTHYGQNSYLLAGEESSRDSGKFRRRRLSSVFHPSVSFTLVDSNSPNLVNPGNLRSFSYRHGAREMREPGADEDPFSGGMTNVLYLDGHAAGRKYMDMILNVSDGDIRTTYGNRNIPNRRPMLAGFYYDNVVTD